MNILHIIPNLTKGGAERICLDIANEIQSRKEHNYLLVLLDEENEYQELSSNTNLKVTSSKLKLKVFGKDNNDLDDLQNIVDDFKPDIIHSHLFLAELFSKHIKSDAKRFAHVHDNMSQLEKVPFVSLTNKQAIVKQFERSYYKKISRKRTTHFLCISKDTESFIENTLEGFNKKSHFFPNAINLERFLSQPKEVNPNKIRICNIGSFAPKKAQSFLIDVAMILKNDHQLNFEIDFLGDGPEKSTVKDKVGHLNLGNQVNFHNNVSNPEEFLRLADLYVHTAKYEPFGLVLIEAMASGTPVITSDGKGNRDFMTKKNGILLKDRDPHLFAEKIMELIYNKELYSSIAKEGIQTARKYDISQYVDNLLDLYKRV